MPVAGRKQSKGPGAADLLTQSPINIHKRLGSVGFVLTVNLRCPNSNEAWLRPFHLFKCDAIHQYCQVLVESTLLAGIDWTKSACVVMTAEPVEFCSCMLLKSPVVRQLCRLPLQVLVPIWQRAQEKSPNTNARGPNICAPSIMATITSSAHLW